MYTYGSIIPLIGGMTIAAKSHLGYDPKWIASWGDAFGANDQYCLNYFKDVPYKEVENLEQNDAVDIALCLPPCAGLSGGNLSTKGSNPRGCNAPSNTYMLMSSEVAMSKLGAKAIMVENAPALFSEAGRKFADRIVALANNYGYSMSLIKTSTIYHGIPQERTRSFFFLWRGNKVPVMEPIRKPSLNFVQHLQENYYPDQPSVNTKKYKPSEDPLLGFILSKYTYTEIFSHFASEKMTSTWNIIYDNGMLDEAIAYIDANYSNKLGERASRWLRYAKGKKAMGKNILNGTTKIAYKRTNALMWQTMPHLAHPFEDRWLTVGEALSLMGFPRDFITSSYITSKSSNVICQNVPVCTAQDWFSQVIKALDGELPWIDVLPGQILRQNNCSKNKTMTPVVY